jgi:Mrp family chromosome partitioning ATPase
VRELVEWAAPRYDVVMFDTPPLASVADAALLSPVVNAFLLVVRAGSTPREALTFAVDQLSLVGASVIGAVLNDVDLERDAEYDAVYRYYGVYRGSPLDADQRPPAGPGSPAECAAIATHHTGTAARALYTFLDTAD